MKKKYNSTTFMHTCRCLSGILLCIFMYTLWLTHNNSMAILKLHIWNITQMHTLLSPWVDKFGYEEKKREKICQVYIASMKFISSIYGINLSACVDKMSKYLHRKSFRPLSLTVLLTQSPNWQICRGLICQI